MDFVCFSSVGLVHRVMLAGGRACGMLRCCRTVEADEQSRRRLTRTWMALNLYSEIRKVTVMVVMVIMNVIVMVMAL